MPTLRIAFDSEIFLRQRSGGISVHFYSLIKHLISTSQCRIFVLLNVREIPKYKRNLKFLELERLDKLTFIRYEFPHQLFKKIHEYKIELIHATYINPFLTFLPIPIVYTFHDNCPEKFLFKFPRFSYLLKITIRLYCFLFSKSIVFISDFTYREFISMYRILFNILPSKNVLISGNSISFDSPILLDNKSKVHLNFTYIGLRGFYKNFEACVLAIDIFLKKHPLLDIKLNIIGGGRFNNNEEELLSQCSFSYEHYAYIDQSELNTIYNYSNLFIHSSYYEGFGITVLEALYLKVPVVAVDIPPVRAIAKESIFYSKDESPNSLSSAIDEFYNAPYSRINTMLEVGHSLARRYTWTRISELHLSFYEKAITYL